MIYYSTETYIALTIAAIPAIVSLFLKYSFDKPKAAWWLLVLSCLGLRFVVISLDPFLQDWDERFHALVAKNMMENPFVPMMRVEDIYETHYKAWCCNHIWLHKQPLFLWQMALSMKLFGVNEIALRLPLVLMGVGMLFFIRRIAHFWTKDSNVAYVAAFLFTFSSFHLQWTSCRVGMDHNDISFTFYVTASIWALSHYLDKKTLKWAIWVGVFVGCAVLNKWLTGILVFSGWGLYVLLNASERKNWKSYWHPILAFGVALLVFMPWQLYISYRFPLESSWEYAYNTKHFFEAVEDHKGDSSYYYEAFLKLYGGWFIPFLVIGILVILVQDRVRQLSTAFLTMGVVLYLFFTVAASKLLGYSMPVISIVYILMAVGVVNMGYFIWKLFPNIDKVKKIFVPLFLGILAAYCLKPEVFADQSSKNNTWRNAKIYNTQIFKNLDRYVPTEYNLIFNLAVYQEVELMFYQDVMAYSWYPKVEKLAELKKDKQYKMAVFKTHGKYGLSSWMTGDSSLYYIDVGLKE